MNKSYPLLFAGSSLQSLAGEIAKLLNIPVARSSLSQFPDNEIKVEIQESVTGRDVFVLQSTGLEPNFYLMELLLMADALKRAGAKNIIAIIPYFGYSRQDRKDKQGVPITAKLIANLLDAAGVTNLITFDLHSPQIEGFFEIPVTHLHCQSLLANEVISLYGKDFTVVAPDVGSIKICKTVFGYLQTSIVVVEKQRISSNQVNMNLIGTLSSEQVLIMDDMCSTGGTLISAANLCKGFGAKKIIAAVTHGIFSGNAIQEIENSPIDALLTTNTLPTFDKFQLSSKIKISSIAPMLAEVIEGWVY